MYTIGDYLRSLDDDKNNLVNYLTIKGQTASITETFTTLVPKVLNITSVNNQSKSLSVTSNNTYTLTPDTGYTGLSSAEITVNVEPSLQSKSTTITSNGTTTVTPDTGYYGLSSNEITVNVEPTLQSKSTSITTNGTTTVTPDTGYDGLSSVNITTDVQGGTVSAPQKDVNFYDFENTRLYSYTKAEFLSLSALPSVPAKEGLVSQGWNWSFADAYAYVQEYGILNIGATYTTSDGATRVYIDIPNDGILAIPINFFQSKNDGVTINWGDGSNTETVTGASVTVTHTYPSLGSYVISLLPDGDTTLQLGHNSSQSKIVGTIQDSNSIYRNMVTKIICGNNCTFTGSNTFYNFYTLKTLSISKSITSIGTEIFDYSNLSIIIIPDSVTNISTSGMHRQSSLERVILPNTTMTVGTSLFFQNQALKEFIIPSSWTSIPNYLFASTSCRSLTGIIIPKTVTYIGQGMFDGSYLGYIDCSHHTQLLTLYNGSSLGALQSYTKIIVPDSLYNEWVADANWSSYATNIIKKSDWDAL